MHPDAPRPIEPLIGEAVHLLVHITRTSEGRRVQEILEVDGYESGRYALRQI
jgi:type IV secretion system protein VirB11